VDSNEDCIFCKIIKGEIPCSKIYENEKVLAFLDIGPVNKGHVIVIPKEHHETVFVTPDDLLGEMMIVVKKIGTAVKSAFDADFVNVLVYGLDVAHAHIHVIPRYHDDGIPVWPQGKYGDGEMQECAEKIVNFLKE
jgi:histidine triad (HIT) family protein